MASVITDVPTQAQQSAADLEQDTAAMPAQSERPGNAQPDVELLVEDVSIDGMCGVY